MQSGGLTKMLKFIDPPMVRASRASLFPSVISLGARQTHRITGTLRCLQRLRPDWVGCILSKDCIDYIAHVGADDNRLYRIEGYAPLEFHIEIDGQPNLDLTHFKWTEFDRMVRTTSGVEFVIAFYWWPDDNPIERAKEYETLTQHVINLLPQTLRDQVRFKGFCGPIRAFCRYAT